MEDIIEILKSNSNKLDLWTKTKAHGLICLQNYLEDDSSEEPDDLKKMTVDNFIFAKRDQSLIFFNQFNESSIFRTTYSIVTTLTDTTEIRGHYSLDNDKDGIILDEWLIIK